MITYLNIINLEKSVRKGDDLKSLAKIENLIVSTLLSLHEYKEWEFLVKYYDGKIDLTPKEAEEFVSLCGERGYSAAERLRCQDAESPNSLIDVALKRALYWQKQYNIYSVIEPEKADFYSLLVSSYNILIMDIREAINDYSQAKEILNRTSGFLGLSKSKTEIS